MQKFIVLIVLLLSLGESFGQGIVRGKVTDKNGESLIGVTLVVKGNTSIGAATDLDGNYSISVKGQFAIRFSSHLHWI